MKLDVKKMQIYMLRNCWSVADLQRKAGLANTTIYKIIHGRNNASSATIGKIAKALNVDVTEVIEMD